MSRCSKKCNEIKQKIDSISGLDDEWIYGNLLALESQVNVIVKSIEKYADDWIYGNLLALESQVNDIVKSIEKYADEVEILEDNTEEIEEIEIDENNYIHTKDGSWKGRKMDLAFAKIINKLIENVKEMKEGKEQ